MSKVDTDIIVPSSPADREAIFAVIKEMSNSRTRIEAEQDYQREALKELEEKYEIKAKYLRRMLTDYHKQQFDDKVAEADAYSELYDAIVS